ncbi:MAG: TetR/AcrR family transcriptional regulator [Chloroflexi bacterium]|nr:TetR/AcrR family transcriptional regulator [Chloroflexota bacterium]
MTDKRKSILEATLHLISERGFHNTPMSLVAKTSGVSVGIIYHYFSSKEELINALYKETKLEILQAMLVDYSDALSLNERFVDIWTNYVRYSLTHPTKGSFLEQFENSPLIKHMIEEEIMQAVVPFFAFFEQGVAQGVFKLLPPVVLFDLGFATAVSLVKRHIANVIVLDDTLMQAATDACWDAITR